jgi:hypothetical protein
LFIVNTLKVSKELAIIMISSLRLIMVPLGVSVVKELRGEVIHKLQLLHRLLIQ